MLGKFGPCLVTLTHTQTFPTVGASGALSMPDARTWNTLDEELDQCCAFVAGISLEGQGRLPFRACLKCLKREESLALVIV